jgi:hypothetical protein
MIKLLFVGVKKAASAGRTGATIPLRSPIAEVSAARAQNRWNPPHADNDCVIAIKEIAASDGASRTLPLSLVCNA